MLQKTSPSANSSTSRVLLRVERLRKYFGDVEAVSALNFDLCEGEIVALLGPNGAGKTTSIECILGLIPPDEGKITIMGSDISENPQECRQKLGAQLQKTELPDAMTPYQAIKLMGKFYRNRADPTELIERFHLQETAHHPFRSLSGGQKQRLALALAFVNHPQLLVLDEPTAGLDPQLRKELLQIIIKSKEKGCGILMATHNLEEAERIADRVIVLDHGKTLSSGSPSELAQGYDPLTRIHFRTTKPVSTNSILSLSAVESVESDDSRHIVYSSDSNQTLLELFQMLTASEAELTDLNISKPTLEQAFFQLTGNRWPGAEGKEKTPR